MLKLKIISLVTIILSIFSNAQIPEQSFRIFPSTITQSEPIVTKSRSNPNLFFGSAVTFNTNTAFRSEGVYVSTNGGITWFGSDTCSGPIILNHGGDPGVVITPNNRLVLTHIGSVFFGMYSHYSDNFGSTWSSAYTISNNQVEDKSSTIIDDNPSSSFLGRIYLAFVSLQTSPFKVYFSYSTNEASSWTTPVVINPNPPARSSGPDLAIKNDGKIFLCWAGMTSTAPIREDFISFASSSDGGINWYVSENIFDVNGITGSLAAKNNIRVNGLPRIAIDNSNGPFKGRIYIVTNEVSNLPAGDDPDIILHYSDNDGITWSQGIRVNQDSFNNGKIQYLPAIDVDDNGGVNIIFYDDRNTTSDSAEVFLARSTNGGINWLEFPISGHRFKPKSVIGGPSNYQGDYITVLSSENKIHAFWMDDYSGIYQIWSRIIDINSLNVENHIADYPKQFTLFQNYPNPFNPATRISWYSPESSWQTLKILDILGNEIVTLIDEYKSAGNYELEFDAAKYNLPSGIYYYRLTTVSYSETKKMILLR
ncbi:BNR/Asp-box repeat protein [Ignavibacterium album JCM 16511]|uniref:BNR/Asp-box repeat protein n=1 Tax=Ignavibacterium album (strain DSM 19864 / JCM 16511 / NBRC 101810 / Mat9-16) TaxID=945713 RepID=I0AKI8_IGNAJ|nr:T9SS type A sorting domain-containing protein [Ignavibacterium album]AFH49495.1 BNR/Asp-box repeat protein [Ignavibacterium album JCM 16511]